MMRRVLRSKSVSSAKYLSMSLNVQFSLSLSCTVIRTRPSRTRFCSGVSFSFSFSLSPSFFFFFLAAGAAATVSTAAAVEISPPLIPVEVVVDDVVCESGDGKWCARKCITASFKLAMRSPFLINTVVTMSKSLYPFNPFFFSNKSPLPSPLPSSSPFLTMFLLINPLLQLRTIPTLNSSATFLLT